MGDAKHCTWMKSGNDPSAELMDLRQIAADLQGAAREDRSVLHHGAQGSSPQGTACRRFRAPEHISRLGNVTVLDSTMTGRSAWSDKGTCESRRPEAWPEKGAEMPPHKWPTQ